MQKINAEPHALRRAPIVHVAIGEFGDRMVTLCCMARQMLQAVMLCSHPGMPLVDPPSLAVPPLESSSHRTLSESSN
jgi:hypothetical protein